MKNSVAFIFDMDGVIVDSNPAHKIALIEFCAEHGHTLTEDVIREKIYGRTNKDWIMNVFGPLPMDQIMAYQEEKEALYRKIYDKDIVEVPGLTPFLDKMQDQGITCAIGTSAPRANVDFTLSKTKTESYFPIILDESFVTRGKPDPEIYLKAVKALDMEPGQCIVFEDSLSGVKAGKAAGCKVVGITTTHTPEELHEADLIIGDFVDLDPKTLITELFPSKNKG